MAPSLVQLGFSINFMEISKFIRRKKTSHKRRAIERTNEPEILKPQEKLGQENLWT